MTLESFGGPLSITDIALRTQVPPTTIALKLRALVNAGLVIRTKNDFDRRINVYVLASMESEAATPICIHCQQEWERQQKLDEESR